MTIKEFIRKHARKRLNLRLHYKALITDERHQHYKKHVKTIQTVREHEDLQERHDQLAKQYHELYIKCEKTEDHLKTAEMVRDHYYNRLEKFGLLIEKEVRQL